MTRSSAARAQEARHSGPAVGRVGGREASWQSSIVRTQAVTEIHARARAQAGVVGAEASAESAYESLLEALRVHGACPSDVVAEKIFVADIREQGQAIERVRDRFYGLQYGRAVRAPASSVLQQPPLDPASAFEVKAFALLASDGWPMPLRRLEGLPPGISGCVVQQSDLRLVHLSGITCAPPRADSSAEGQAASMFRRAQSLLLPLKMTFHDVFRTWIYLPEIDRDYGALNHARRGFFNSLGIDPPPASTGIQGVPPLPGRLCSMDLRAVAGLPAQAIRAIHAPTLNEAPSYGSDFSRGTRVELPDRTLIHLSGTASIDERGEIVHPGSIERQAERMLDNVERLLAGQEAGWEDLVTVTTYLKAAEYVEPFLGVLKRRALNGGPPHTICLARVCRPGWLCELEGLAVLA